MRRALAILALLLLVPATYGAQDPALPPGLGGEETAESGEKETHWTDRLPPGLGGFVEARVGPRTGSDPAHSEELTLGELRLQLGYERAFRRVSVEAKGDLILDAVLDDADADLRALRVSLRPARTLDLSVGRQVMTWGTGDLIFINDLFPKDWQSFLSGRDEDYLKAPSDAIRLGWFPGKVSIDLAYTPEFDPDRFVSGERISFWDPLIGGFRGDAAPVVADTPRDTFDDDEIALRIYGSAGAYELSAYGYRGFWKSPGGFDPVSMRATFPALDVWGASVRGPLGRGIANLEFGRLDSRDDRDGSDPLVDNGEHRLLLGYERELGTELTGGFQYYVERMRDHQAYLAALPAGAPRDEVRHVLTTRITKMLRGQTLIPSLFAYYSPSDGDGYLRPGLVWKRTDRQVFELGANLFFGRNDHTFFGQFENNSNVYLAFRLQP